jgi:hypothetical protein
MRRISILPSAFALYETPWYIVRRWFYGASWNGCSEGTENEVYRIESIMKLLSVLRFVLGRLWISALLGIVGVFILHGTLTNVWANDLHFWFGLVLGRMFVLWPILYIARDTYYAITWRRNPEASRKWFEQYCGFP